MNSKHQVNLLDGPIAPALARLALPVMAGSLVQMMYNFVDMMWVGRLGSAAVAAVGSAGIYLWIADGVLLTARMGGQILTGRELGAKNTEAARKASRSALQISILLGLILTVLFIWGRGLLIGVFRLEHRATAELAETYLLVTAFGLIFALLARSLSALLVSLGNSQIPFRVNSVGLILNVILDPLFIFTFKMGVMGAALATSIAQFTVFIIFLFYVRRQDHFRDLRIFTFPDWRSWLAVTRIGLPATFQTVGFALIYLVISRMVSSFGDAALAAQKIGSQIESLTWLTAEGFQAALTAFTAQNFGARRLDRSQAAYRSSMKLITVFGFFSTSLLYFGAEPLFGVFLTDPIAIQAGVSYLRILALAQWPMCIEAISAAAFYGYGRTIFPATVVLATTLLRIPLAWILSRTPLGLNGIWWAITTTCVIVGILMVAAFRRFSSGLPSRYANHSAGTSGDITELQPEAVQEGED